MPLLLDDHDLYVVYNMIQKVDLEKGYPLISYLQNLENKQKKERELTEAQKQKELEADIIRARSIPGPITSEAPTT